MTTFGEPEAGLLVEHLLPSLLGTSYSLPLEIQERTLFFGELSTALEMLRGRLTVISSPARHVRRDSDYPWLWRYVSHFIVGADAPATQHAKLWAFHWKANDGEYLELYVSSTNLTTPGFKAQMQAGWRLCMPMRKHASQRARQTWGDLVRFLEALGVSAGTVATRRIERLLTLLGRVVCPKEITFVASMPGKRWVARRLRQCDPSEIHILAPTIGNWRRATLAAWSADAGIVPTKIHLKWISPEHPWAASMGWKLSTAARETLDGVGVQLECLPIEASFTKEHRSADPRWSHAKLYMLRNRRRRQLLITSANWSVAAWGAGMVPARNFELGVLFDSDWPKLAAFNESFEPPDTNPFCVDCADDNEAHSVLQWGEARWDGHSIKLRARSSDCATAITAVITFLGKSSKGISLINGEAVLSWNDAEHTPLAVRFTQDSQMLEVDVLDLRTDSEFAKTPLPEVDPTIAKELREAFLLQRYGGPVVDPESIGGLGGPHKASAAVAAAADYSVGAWLEARTAFHVVDQWRAALTEAMGDPMVADRVLLDGKELRALYARRRGPAFELVVEELGWRLRDTRA